MAGDDIRLNLERIHLRIADAADRAGRNAGEVTLLGASKQVEAERIAMAVELGLGHVGENRVQEAHAKLEQLPSLRSSATWHMIGHLQSNKVRQALALFEVIQSVDSLPLARRIDTVAGELGRRVPVYLEVNLGLEPAKSGMAPDQVMEVAQAVAELSHLRLAGLMAVPPFSGEPEQVRPYFQRLRELRDALGSRSPFQNEELGLSMGMTHDYEVAVEEGATLVRLGTAIWGGRPVP